MELAYIISMTLILHLIGDYVLQSHWMAQMKTKEHLPALIHASIYTSLFCALTLNPIALLLIGGTHFAIDRWRLAVYLIWLKNWMAPPEKRPSESGWRWQAPWSECVSNGGFPASTPPWLAILLLIITDNTMHLAINIVVLWYFHGI